MVQDESKPNELLCNISNVWWDFAEDAAIFKLLLSIIQNPQINLFTPMLPEHFRIHIWKPFEKKTFKIVSGGKMWLFKSKIETYLFFKHPPRKQSSNSN